MGKNQSASNLTNIIKQDANGNISFVSGSTTLMSVSSSGAITTTGNVAGTASYASNAELLDGLDSTVFTLTSSFAAQTASFTAFTSSINSFTSSQNITNGTFTLTSSFAAQTASFTAFTSSINSFSASVLTFTGSAATRLGALETYTSSLNNKTSSFATTGSNTFIGTQVVSGSVLQSGSFISTGTITAQTLVVQTITSSVVYSSGSNIFGNAIGNTQTFTGSVNITGSQTTYGNLLNPNSNFQTYGSASFGVSTWGLSIGNGNASANYYRANDHYFQNGAGTQTLQIASTGAATFSSSVTASIFDSTSNAFRFNGNNALSLVSLSSQNVVKINAAGYWGVQLVGANDKGILIDNTGNVGIGTTSPSYPLTVISNSSTQGFRLAGRSSDNIANISFTSNDQATEYAFMNTGATYWAIGTSGSERMRITSGGNVGIGTTSPSQLLTLRSTSGYPVIDFWNNSTAYGDLGYQTGAGMVLSAYSSTPLLFYTNSAERMRITSGGNVGIGTTPNTWNTVYKTLQIGASMSLLQDGSSVSSYWGGNLYVGTDGNYKYTLTGTAGLFGLEGNSLVLYNAASGTADTTASITERFRITSAGNVGIGTSSPSTLLHINTAARTSGTNVNILTLSDTVTGVQTSGYGVRIVGTSNNGSAVSAIAFEADGGTNNDTAIAFYTQSTANALTRRVTVLRNGQLQVLQSANTYSDGLRLINTTNNYWNIVMGGDNTLYFGYNAADKASLTTSGVFNSTGGGTSDKRKKQNIEYIQTSCIDSIKMLKPVKFEFINNPEKTRRGFIAQDVLEVIPDLVLGDGELEGGTYGLDYDGILALAVKSIQELNTKLDAANVEIEALKAK